MNCQRSDVKRMLRAWYEWDVPMIQQEQWLEDIFGLEVTGKFTSGRIKFVGLIDKMVRP